jgi:hypothetical protein
MREGIIEIFAWWCDVCVKIYSPIINRFNRSSDEF